MAMISALLLESWSSHVLQQSGSTQSFLNSLEGKNIVILGGFQWGFSILKRVFYGGGGGKKVPLSSPCPSLSTLKKAFLPQLQLAPKCLGISAVWGNCSPGTCRTDALHRVTCPLKVFNLLPEIPICLGSSEYNEIERKPQGDTATRWRFPYQNGFRMDVLENLL